MKEFKLKCYESNEIAVYVWDEVANPTAVVQISHGMAEWCVRYDHFASFLNSNGYVVIADDHRGHGKTSGFSEKGIVEGDSFHDTVEDMYQITRYAAETYKLPVLLFGHSYGSFLSQAYIEKYGDAIKGVILSGTAYMNSGLVKTGNLLAGAIGGFLGMDTPAKLISKMTFGSYDKLFASESQKFAWLSRDKAQVEKYAADEFCGYPMCYGFQFSFFKGILKASTSRAIGRIPKNLPILITGGEEDPVGEQGKLPRRLFEEYKKAQLTDVSIKLYPGARHEILNELNQAEVYADILSFIQGVFGE